MLLSRSLAALLISLTLLAGCLSPERRAELDGLLTRVDTLKVHVEEAERVRSADLESLRAQLAAAKGDLQAAKEAALSEQVLTTAKYVETGATTLQPWVAGIPFAGQALALLATIAGAVRAYLGKKQE